MLPSVVFVLVQWFLLVCGDETGNATTLMDVSSTTEVAEYKNYDHMFLSSSDSYLESSDGITFLKDAKISIVAPTDVLVLEFSHGGDRSLPHYIYFCFNAVKHNDNTTGCGNSKHCRIQFYAFNLPGGLSTGVYLGDKYQTFDTDKVVVRVKKNLMEAKFLDETGKKIELESRDCEWDTTGGVFDVEVKGAEYGTVLLKDAHVYVPPTSPPASSNSTASIATAEFPFMWVAIGGCGLALVLGIVLTGVLIYFCCCNKKKDAKKDAETELSSVVTKRTSGQEQTEVKSEKKSKRSKKSKRKSKRGRDDSERQKSDVDTKKKEESTIKNDNESTQPVVKKEEAQKVSAKKKKAEVVKEPSKKKETAAKTPMKKTPMKTPVKTPAKMPSKTPQIQVTPQKDVETKYENYDPKKDKLIPASPPLRTAERTREGFPDASIIQLTEEIDDEVEFKKKNPEVPPQAKLTSEYFLAREIERNGGEKLKIESDGLITRSEEKFQKTLEHLRQKFTHLCNTKAAVWTFSLDYLGIGPITYLTALKVLSPELGYHLHRTHDLYCRYDDRYKRLYQSYDTFKFTTQFLGESYVELYGKFGIRDGDIIKKGFVKAFHQRSIITRYCALSIQLRSIMNSFVIDIENPLIFSAPLSFLFLLSMRVKLDEKTRKDLYKLMKFRSHILYQSEPAEVFKSIFPLTAMAYAIYTKLSESQLEIELMTPDMILLQKKMDEKLDLTKIWNETVAKAQEAAKKLEKSFKNAGINDKDGKTPVKKSEKAKEGQAADGKETKDANPGTTDREMVTAPAGAPETDKTVGTDEDEN